MVEGGRAASSPRSSKYSANADAPLAHLRQGRPSSGSGGPQAGFLFFLSSLLPVSLLYASRAGLGLVSHGPVSRSVLAPAARRGHGGVLQGQFASEPFLARVRVVFLLFVLVSPPFFPSTRSFGRSGSHFWLLGFLVPDVYSPIFLYFLDCSRPPPCPTPTATFLWTPLQLTRLRRPLMTPTPLLTPTPDFQSIRTSLGARMQRLG